MGSRLIPAFGLVDVHAHVLPGMDDGARDADEAARLLELSDRQGVQHVWATPHFYPKREDPEAFLRRRERAIRWLCDVWNYDSMPRVYAAAEVAYFCGIGRSAYADELCLEGTPYILVEMPEDEWSPDTVEDLLLLRFFRNLRPIIAHVERCIGYQSRRTLARLTEEGVLFQCNARFLANYEANKRQIKSLFRADRLDLIGSDFHNMRLRQPNIPSALHALGEVAEEEKLRAALKRAADITRTATPCCY